MPSVSVNLSTIIGGVSMSGTLVRSAETPLVSEITVPAGKTATLTTRTDNNTGTFTVEAGHGFITSDVIDVFWDDGLHSSMVATVSGNSVVLDGGEGDNLPLALASVVLSKRQILDQGFNGDDLEFLLVSETKKGSVRFMSDDTTIELSINLADGEMYSWASDLGVTNPLVGVAVVHACISNGSTTASTLRIGALLDTVS